MSSPKLKNLVEQWLKYDTNAASRKEIEDLAASGADAELEKRLGARIAFGTAGLRGRMQPGFAGMNDVTVAQASQGLCKYLMSTVEDVEKKGICVGWDGRYNSRRWADLTAAIFLHSGIPVYRITELTATPIVPYCVLVKGCAAGVMVTASHNPKDDNGYKVYWSNGCQIVSPHDSRISKCIEENLDLWPINIEETLKSELLKDPTQEISDRYSKEIAEKYCFHRDLNTKSQMRIVFTAMHGVGKEWVARAFKSFGLPPYVPVPEQIEANPDFPTVPFPNPEEGKGALELSMKTADAHNSRLVIANDPDSDRLAVAEKQADGTWKIFNGNEIGILLAHWVWTQYKAKNPDVDPANCAMLNTTVSSKMMKAMAEKEGLYYEETLTGFKWLGNKAEELTKAGKTFLFAFEEAIGFMVGDICLDKDGVRGAAVFAEMAVFLDAQKLTCLGHLKALYKQYGFFATNNRYFFCYDPKVMESIFHKMRNNGKYSESVGPFKVKDIRDLTVGFDTTRPDKKPVLPVSSSTQMITYFFENGCVATLRGSGTEPKLKYYVEMSGDDEERVTKELNQVVDAIIEHLLQPELNNLQKPSD